MAILRLETGQTFTDQANIDCYLAPLGIGLNRWPLGKDPQVIALLAEPSLEDDQKETVLRSLEHYFETLKTTSGYQSRDLIVLNPNTPNLDTLLAKFNRPHTHADDEVRYIVDGEGVFGFTAPNGTQLELTVQAEDYINVPARTEHWFYLTSWRCIKAVRYFSSTEGWVPEYTDTSIRLQPIAV